MPPTTVPALEHTTHTTQKWLLELTEEGGFQDPSQAYSAMRAALHAIRDRLTPDEAADLAAQLPMMVRGFYYEGYRPSLAPSPERTPEEFLDHVRASLTRNQTIDPEHAVTTVLRFLERKIGSGEMDDVRGMIPAEIRDRFWPRTAVPT